MAQVLALDLVFPVHLVPHTTIVVFQEQVSALEQVLVPVLVLAPVSAQVIDLEHELVE